MSVQMIRKWCQQFKAEWEPIKGTWCFMSLIHTDENGHLVEKLILSYHLITVTELEAATGLAKFQIRQFIRKLGFPKDLTKMLTEDNLMRSFYFLLLYHRNLSIIQ